MADDIEEILLNGEDSDNECSEIGQEAEDYLLDGDDADFEHKVHVTQKYEKQFTDEENSRAEVKTEEEVEEDDVLHLDFEADEDFQDLELDKSIPENRKKRVDKFQVEKSQEPADSKQNLVTTETGQAQVNKVVQRPNKNRAPFKNRKTMNQRNNFQTKFNFNRNLRNNMQQKEKHSNIVLVNPEYSGTVHINENNARLAWDKAKYPPTSQQIQPWVSGNYGPSVSNMQNNLAQPEFFQPPSINNVFSAPPAFQQPVFTSLSQQSFNPNQGYPSWEPPPPPYNSVNQGQGIQNNEYSQGFSPIENQQQLSGFYRAPVAQSNYNYYDSQQNNSKMEPENRFIPFNYNDKNTSYNKNNYTSNNFENNRNADNRYENKSYNNYNRGNAFNYKSYSNESNAYVNRNVNYGSNYPENRNNNQFNSNDFRRNDGYKQNPNNFKKKFEKQNNFKLRLDNQNNNKNFQVKPVQDQRQINKPIQDQRQNNKPVQDERQNNINQLFSNEGNKRYLQEDTTGSQEEGQQPEKIKKVENDSQITVTPESKTTSIKSNLIGDNEEDEETRLYRLKIEEQKRERERILKLKEERRMMALQQQQNEQSAHPRATEEQQTENLKPRRPIQQRLQQQSIQSQEMRPGNPKVLSLTTQQKPRQQSTQPQEVRSGNFKQFRPTIQQKFVDTVQTQDLEPSDADMTNLTFRVTNNLVRPSTNLQNKSSTTTVQNRVSEVPVSGFMSNRIVSIKNSSNNPQKNLVKAVENYNNDSSMNNAGHSGSSFFSNRKIVTKDESLINSRLVVVNNLSSGTSQEKLMAMTRGIGEIQVLMRRVVKELLDKTEFKANAVSVFDSL